MAYIYKLKAVNGNEVNYITVFAPLESETIIGWGPDEAEPDGIKRWKVREQLPELVPMPGIERLAALKTK